MLESFDKPVHALVIGASRGIGLALVQRLLAQMRVAHVYAACRRPVDATDLVRLQMEHNSRLTILSVDVTVEETLAMGADTVRRGGNPLSLLINCAGCLHEGAKMRPERRLEDVDASNLARAFAVNATGALLVARHFVPLLDRSTRSVFAALSARVGSIGDNQLGGWYAYRASKAAQNQITRTLAIELARSAPLAVVVALHPGTVATGLSEPFRGSVPKAKLFTTADAAQRLLSVIDGLDSRSSGGFFAWDGSEIPW